MSKVGELDYEKAHVVKVLIKTGMPSPLPLEKLASTDTQDLRWNPFNRAKTMQRLLNADRVEHTVVIDKLHLPMRELTMLARDIREFHKKQVGGSKAADIVDDAERMTTDELACVVNTWIGIVKHFGNKAHYRREFINMMRSVPEVLMRVGL